MSTQDDGIRKAAILVASLDRATADVVLDQLAPQQAQRVRQFLVELDEDSIDAKEQRRVIDEFFRVGPMVPKREPPGIELDERLARRLSMPQTDSTADAACRPLASDSRPFRFLHEAEAEKLARVLAGERPQTIALVLSHLPADRAGSVLVRLQGALQADVVRRLVDLEETDPQILRDVERALESHLSQHVRMQRRRVAGMKAIAGILEASQSRVGMQILDNLATYDQHLAERLSPPALQI
jgi:flagellar motor switch protein FliG